MGTRRLLLLVALLWPVGASAQGIVESAGSRALGMGGAFVGVADDATAAYWNPAGLASGPPAGMTIGWVDFRTGNQNATPVPGPTHRTSKFVSLGTLPVAISYGTFEESRIATDLTRGDHSENVRISHFGTTIVQTVAQGFVVGTTVKYLRGSAVSGPINGVSTRDALNAAAKLEGSASGTIDVDVGVMADFGKARLGVTMRNLREPTFSDGAGTAIQLRRQSRVGLAVLPARGLTLAMDLDLDTVALRDGPRRILAFGVEQRLGTRWALRGGTRWSLEGSKRRVAAVGGSVALRRSLWLDWHYTSGGIDADRGYGVALRVGS
jgi:hypothetical protein